MESPPNVEVPFFAGILVHYMSWINKTSCSQVAIFYAL